MKNLGPFHLCKFWWRSERRSHVGLTGTSVLATYEGAAYRNALTGALSRVQHTITIGVALTPFTPKEAGATHEAP